MTTTAEKVAEHRLQVPRRFRTTYDKARKAKADAGKAYDEAKAEANEACDKAGEVYDEAWKAYDKAKAEAKEAYDKAIDAYNKAKDVYDEAYAKARQPRNSEAKND